MEGVEAGPTVKGDHHECATAIALDGDIGGDCYPRLRTTGGAAGRTYQYWCAKLRLHPGFLRHMASRKPSLVHSAGVGSRSSDESVADQGYRRERLQFAGRGLQESDLAGLGRRRREEEGRTLAGRRGVSEPGQHLLARTSPVPVQARSNADAAATGPDRDAFQREP